MSKAMKKRIRSEEDEVDNKPDAEFDDSEDESEVSKSGNSDDDDDKEVKESVKHTMIDGRARVTIPNKNTSASEMQNIAKQLPKKAGRKWVFDTYGSEDGKNKYADFISIKEAVKESASLEPLIKQLRSSYGSIDKIDPEGPAYKRLIAILDKADVSTLKALVSADIKFVSVLARNRLTRKGVKESTSDDLKGKLKNGNYAEGVRVGHRSWVVRELSPTGKIVKSHRGLKTRGQTVEKIKTLKDGVNESVSKESAKKVDQLIAKHGFVIAKDKAGWFHLKAKDKDVKKNAFDKIKMPPSRVIGPWRSIEQLVQAVEKRGDSMFNESVIVEGRISVGSRVKVAHKGKMVSGKVVRFSKPDDFYVVDVGDVESVKVPAHELEGVKESVMEAKKPQRFDTVRVKSMNTTGMVYSVTGSKAEIRTPTKLITVDVKDLEVVQMDEAKSDYTLYHKTYSDAVQHAVQVAKKRGFEVDEDDFFNKVTTGPKKPSSGKTNSVSIELTKSGKPVKQKLNMQVYNMDNRSYELNMYIESTQVPPTAKGEDEPKEEDDPKSPYVDNPSDKRIGSDSILKYHQMKKKIMDRPDAEKQDGSDEVVPAKKPSKTFESFCSELTTESTYEVDIDGYGHTTVKASTEKQAMNLGLAKLHVSPAARKGFNKSKIKVRLKESE